MGIAWAAIIFIASGAARAQGEEPSLAYTVQPSDKLIRLSRDLLREPADWSEVALVNRMRNPDLIRPGQQLRIPLRLLKFDTASARLVGVQGSVTLGDQPAAAGAQVAEGARLATGADSSAVLELADGSRFKLMPNTATELAVHRNYLMRGGAPQWFSGLLRLAHGAVESSAAAWPARAEPLQVRTPTAALGVRGTQFRAGHDPATRASRSEVTEGRVRADNPAQQSGADLAAGTGAKIDPAVRDIRVVPLLPAPDLSALPAQIERPGDVLPLPAVAGAAALRVQVAADAAFNGIVRDLRIAGASAPLGSLPAGNWNVRVRGIDADGIEGFDSTRALVVAEAPPPPRVTLSWLRFDGTRTLLQLRFDPAPTGPVRAVLSSAPGMAPVLREGTPAGEDWDLGSIASGNYFVQFHLPVGTRTRTTDVMRLVVPSDWATFTKEAFGPVGPR